MPADGVEIQDRIGEIVPKKTTSKSVLPPKTEWHPLSLQRLGVEKFVLVVNRILEGDKYTLLPELLPIRENETAKVSGFPIEALPGPAQPGNDRKKSPHWPWKKPRTTDSNSTASETTSPPGSTRKLAMPNWCSALWGKARSLRPKFLRG